MARPAIVFHPEAIAEAHAAIDWYRERNARAAEAFLAELDRGIAEIAAAPARWLEFRYGTRRFLLRRFPFAIIYRETSEAVQIIAVAHARRKPGYWNER
jgi:toxin ParE1/3/4